ncbi:unnamed protein product [Cercopithifilaria johnstoni]|uniref:Uncharacterized protein n=1 Tax=Cercopithifilaria johnstoni TaxID=2874296 RepID=A0A8J2M180_9BILA|nr:unnamed protein product [Cercopithifilaria johnstoni]
MAIDFAAEPDVLLHTSDTRSVKPVTATTITTATTDGDYDDDGVIWKSQERQPHSFQIGNFKIEPRSY